MTEPSFNALNMIALPGIPEVVPGVDLGNLIAQALMTCGEALEQGDIVAVAQKVVSKAEGRMRRLSDITSSSMRAQEIADRSGKDARKVQAILDESSDILRVAAFPPDGLVIARHRHGWVCANAGIDESNVGQDGVLLLLPENPDASAKAIADRLSRCFGVKVGVVITDTFGRAWRRGQVNVAIGVANVPTVVSLVGKEDAYGRRLQVSEPAFADEVAAASGLLMGKDSGTPVIVIRGLAWEVDLTANARQCVRSAKEDLFS
jgi:coenzyme F420-0:L-glutamate ligase/coenzyme F420-1:gamma-L-glutamate ligase